MCLGEGGRGWKNSPEITQNSGLSLESQHLHWNNLHLCTNTIKTLAKGCPTKGPLTLKMQASLQTVKRHWLLRVLFLALSRVQSPPGSSVHGDSPGRNTEVGCQAFLQIFPTQGSNPGLLYCRYALPPEPPGKPLLVASSLKCFHYLNFFIDSKIPQKLLS